MLKAKEKEEILRAARDNLSHTSENKIWTADYSSETTETERSRMVSKVLKY